MMAPTFILLQFAILTKMEWDIISKIEIYPGNNIGCILHSIPFH